MALIISRSFISFSRRSISGALLAGRVLRRGPGLIIIGDVSGSCKMPKLQLKVLTSSGLLLVSHMHGGIPV